MEVPKTDEQKMKKAEANRERKKRRKEQTSGGKAATTVKGDVNSVEAAGEALAVATDSPADKMEVDTQGKVDA